MKFNSHRTNFRELLGSLWEVSLPAKTEGLGIKRKSQALVTVEMHMRANSSRGNMQAALACWKARYRKNLTTCPTRWNENLWIKPSFASLSNMYCSRAHRDLSSSFSFIYKTKKTQTIKQKNRKIYQLDNRGGWGNMLKEVPKLNREQLCGPERAGFLPVTALFTSKRSWLEMWSFAHMKLARN